MTDQAFRSECHLLLECIGAAQWTAEQKLAMLQPILDEGKRIYRLAVHNKLSISAVPSVERAFCLCCALSLKQPNVWAVVLKRLREARTASWWVPQVGEINVSEVTRFIRVATSALKLEAVAVPGSAQVSSSSAAVKSDASSPSYVDEVVAEYLVRRAVGVTPAAAVAATVPECKSRRTSRSSGANEHPAATAPVPGDVGEGATDDAEDRPTESALLRSLVDFSSLSVLVADFQARFPLWRCGDPSTVPSSPAVQRLLGPALSSTEPGRKRNRDDTSLQYAIGGAVVMQRLRR